MSDKKNISLALNMFAVVAGMFCMAYAFVPLYDLFCRVTGFGGTTQEAKVLPEKVLDRTIKVRFNADINKALKWEFKPGQKEIEVQVGESALTFYTAQNLSNEILKGTSTYNVTPSKAGAYFNKVECFCYEEQQLDVGESTDFPVSFFIDPEIVNDKNLDDVNTITLSYTFFKVKES